MKPDTASTIRASEPIHTDCPFRRPFRWGFTNRNRGCGKTWWDEAAEFWNISSRRRSEHFPRPWLAKRWTRSFLRSTTLRPSLVRVEADEATYNLHILIRFELEQALLDDDLAVADLPGRWNEKYQQYLGIRPPDDAIGVLQDIHWAAGLVGYFPTYSLGNLYASQFFARAEADLGSLASQFARGEFQPLRAWLAKTSTFKGNDIRRPTWWKRSRASRFRTAPLMAHLYQKLAPLYGLK